MSDARMEKRPFAPAHHVTTFHLPRIASKIFLKGDLGLEIANRRAVAPGLDPAPLRTTGFSSCRNRQCARCGTLALPRRRCAPCIHDSSKRSTEPDCQITDDQETGDTHRQSLLLMTLNQPCVFILEVGNAQRSVVPGPSP